MASRIVQYFADKLKTIKEYPITLTKAVYDENGERLDDILTCMLSTLQAGHLVDGCDANDYIETGIYSYHRTTKDGIKNIPYFNADEVWGNMLVIAPVSEDNNDDRHFIEQIIYNSNTTMIRRGWYISTTDTLKWNEWSKYILDSDLAKEPTYGTTTKHTNVSYDYTTVASKNGTMYWVGLFVVKTAIPSNTVVLTSSIKPQITRGIYLRGRNSANVIQARIEKGGAIVVESSSLPADTYDLMISLPTAEL